MRFLLILAASLFLTLPVFAGSPVVIENMTTQGCGDSAPAEGILKRIQTEDPDVIILNCHITYFDSEEWKDPFSNPLCDERHTYYYARIDLPGIQSPEFIMNGLIDVNSKEIDVVRGEIARHRAEHPVYDLNLKRTDNTIEMTMPPMTPKEPLDIWLFSYIPEQTSVVNNNLYQEETLNHFNIVTNIAFVGTWDGDPPLLYYDLDKGDERPHAIIVQDRNSSEIIAAGKI